MRPRRLMTTGLVAATVAFILFFQLGSYGLVETSDARYAEIAREMFTSGDYLIPRLLGGPHFDKPPLVYWITSLSYAVFGVNEWGARFSQGVAALTVLLLVYLIARHFFSRSVGLAALLSLVTMPGFIGAERALTTDLLLLVWTTGSLCAFLFWWESRRPAYLLAFYSCMGFSMLTKGPLALFVVLIAIVVFALLAKEPLLLRKILYLPGIALFLALGFWWYLVLGIRVPGLLWHLVMTQLLGRMKSSYIGHPAPLYYYLYMFPALSMPWLAFLPLVVKLRASDPKERAVFLLLATWLVVPLIFFSVPGTKLPLYVIPSLPPLAILVGLVIDRSVAASPPRLRAPTLIGLAPIVLLGLALVLASSGKLHLSRIRYSAAVHVLLEAGGLAIVGAGVAAGVLSLLRPRLAPAALAASMLTVAAVCFSVLTLGEYRSHRQLAKLAGSLAPPKTTFALYGFRAYSLPFYLGQDVLVYARSPGDPYADESPSWYREGNEFTHLWRSDAMVFAFVREDDLYQLPGAVPLGAGNRVALVANHQPPARAASPP